MPAAVLLVPRAAAYPRSYQAVPSLRGTAQPSCCPHQVAVLLLLLLLTRCPPLPLPPQHVLEGQGLQITLDALLRFLKFSSDNYERPDFRGKLPPVQVDGDNKSFVVCS